MFSLSQCSILKRARVHIYTRICIFMSFRKTTRKWRYLMQVLLKGVSLFMLHLSPNQSNLLTQPVIYLFFAIHHGRG